MKLKLAILLTFIPMIASAQVVIDTRPEHNEGKMLTQEEANSYKTSVFPKKFKGEVPEMKVKEEPGLETFEKDGSLYYKDPEGNTHTIAVSEEYGIKYGNIVSRNEFAIEDGWFWSPDQSKLAFYRKDERRVTEFPLLDINSRTGTLFTTRYPMNGMASEIIQLGIYDVSSANTVYIDANDFTEERYLTNVTWSPDSRNIFIQVVDREQHHMHLNMYDAASGEFKRTILKEENDAWIEPLDPLYFIDGTYRFIYRTDNRDGFKNLYLCDTLGNVQRVTEVDADVEYIANDGRYLYYTSSEVSPAEQQLFRIDLKKKVLKPVRLTTERGWHRITMSADCKYYLDEYSSFNLPYVCDLCSSDGKIVRQLLASEDPLKEYKTGKVEFGTIKSADGKFDNHYRLFYPAGFDPTKKYPLIVYVYGGPHSQMVNDSWMGQVRMWEMYMAERGYFVYVQDNRGTQYHGAEYEKAINRQCGQAEMADQMVGVNWLKELPYIDEERIGVHGWSYGGFMTITLTLNHPEIFKVAVAGGPVINWKWYEVMYGERYMDNTATNPEGFELTGLENKADKLKSKLLICQGAVDKTVVWENSLSFIQNCISNNIPVDYFPYPVAEHNMRDIERVHLHNKISEYFFDNL